MTAPQKKATGVDKEVEAAPIETDGEPEPKPKPTNAKAPTTMSKAKKNGYEPEEDALLLALVAEHGRSGWDAEAVDSSTLPREISREPAHR